MTDAWTEVWLKVTAEVFHQLEENSTTGDLFMESYKKLDEDSYEILLDKGTYERLKKHRGEGETPSDVILRMIAVVKGQVH